jgi:nucleoside-diphosphate-sugar epimerase
VIIRPPLVYGAGAKGNVVSMVRWIKKGIPLPFSSVNNKRSFVGIDNLVDFICVCLDHPNAKNEVFLVSDGYDVSLSTFIRAMGVSINKTVRMIPVPVMLMKIFLRTIGKQTISNRLFSSLQIDLKKNKELLNWKPHCSMGAQLKKMNT